MAHSYPSKQATRLLFVQLVSSHRPALLPLAYSCIQLLRLFWLLVSDPFGSLSAKYVVTPLFRLAASSLLMLAPVWYSVKLLPYSSLLLPSLNTWYQTAVCGLLPLNSGRLYWSFRNQPPVSVIYFKFNQ